MDEREVRVVVLAGGRSRRMEFDKLAAPFAGVPLARRVAAALASLRPLVVTSPRVAELLGDLRQVEVVVTEPTAGISVTLALADAAVPRELHLAVIAADLPFLDAARVRAFLRRVPADADQAFPTVDGTPGHPVVWSPRARARIAGLGEAESPGAVRRDPALRVVAIPETDRAYVWDVDTPEMWDEAQRRGGR